MSSGNRRMVQHEAAVNIVASKFEMLGFECHSMGTEVNAKEMQKALRAQYDATSVMLRFRPDRIFVKRGMRSILCEVKSEAKGYQNFAVEVDSYDAAIQWNSMYNHVMHAFVTLPDNSVKCCWLSNVPRPEHFYVPNRPSHRRTIARLKNCWCDVGIEVVRHWGGSGTAYFLIPKDAPYLKPFEQFALEITGDQA